MCAPFGVRAVEPDGSLDALGSDDLHDAVATMSQRRRRPPISTAQLLDRLNPTLPLTVERVRVGGGFMPRNTIFIRCLSSYRVLAV
jgi:hypothetical protein